MSAQRLGEQKLRRLRRTTGLDVVRAWAFGGYGYAWVVADPDHPDRHRHGWYDVKDDTWGFDDNQAAFNYGGHFDTCHELFPDVDRWQSSIAWQEWMASP